MSTKEICALPIHAITDNDCALFMWAADAFLPNAIDVMRSWGFQYKTVAFIWDKREWTWTKTRFMGQWTMKNCELVLLGTKGAMSKYLKTRNVQQVQCGIRVRSKHSKKPQIIRDRITQMFGDLPKIELFARCKVDGWDCWGNEVQSDIELDELVRTEQQELKWRTYILVDLL